MTDRRPQELFSAISNNIETVIHGQKTAIRWLLSALVSGGHVLLEDYPGTGKTTLAKTLAHSINSEYKRIQFTPDLLPSDILGVTIYNQRDGGFTFHKGPIFTHILLADEINRASPRTQSALLEAMAEFQVSIDGNRYLLGDLFFVIATQNPVEFRGTYPLPEAQMDRFALQFSLGYVSPEEEIAILDDFRKQRSLDTLRPQAAMTDILALRRQAEAIRVSDEIKRYIVDIVRSTRSVPGVELGASPRASLALLKSAQALALFDGTPFVTPDHIQELAAPVIAHRLAMAAEARFSGQTSANVVKSILETLPAPA